MTRQPIIEPADIIAGAWRNLNRNWRLYSEYAVWIACLSVLMWAFGVLIRSAVPDKTMSSIMFFLLSVPVSLVYALIACAEIDATARALQRKPVSAGQSLRVGLHKLVPFIWVSILTALAVGFGLVLLIVPGVIFSVWFAFAANEVVIDDVRGRRALGASRELTSHRSWGILVRLILPYLFYYFAVKLALALAYLLLGAVLGDPGLFFGAITDIYAVPTYHVLLTTVLPQVFYAFGLPLFFGSNIILWLDLKKKPA